MGFLNFFKRRNCIKIFSLEFITLGRNDDYEPNWTKNLYSVIQYNYELFEGTEIDFRFAFVEWNPLADKLLLSPMLVEKFPYLRAIVVDRKIHEELCEADDLNMMLNFPYNAALRTSECDFAVISGGDEFIGRDVKKWFQTKGVKKNCLYRATRVDVRNDLEFSRPDPCVFEKKENFIRVNKSDKKPYTNGCGDFIMMDIEAFHRLRGYDENVRVARAHLDSRCCFAAMKLGMNCKLIGNTYHIDHARALNNSSQSYPGQHYDFKANLPYKNPENWGLKDYVWHKEGERLFYVS